MWAIGRSKNLLYSFVAPDDVDDVDDVDELLLAADWVVFTPLTTMSFSSDFRQPPRVLGIRRCSGSIARCRTANEFFLKRRSIFSLRRALRARLGRAKYLHFRRR